MMTSEQYSKACEARRTIPGIGRRRLVKLTGCTDYAADMFLQGKYDCDMAAKPLERRALDAESRLKEHKVQLAAVKRERDELLSEFTDLRNARPVPKSPAAKPMTAKADTVRVSFGDLHGMMMDKAAVAALLRDLRVLDPDEIVMLGDMLECGGFLAKHHAVGFVALTDYSYQEDVKATNWFLDEVQKAAPRAVMHYQEGNHECLHPDHEVLTRAGWKPIQDVTTDDTVACLGEMLNTEWHKPTKTHVYNHDGDLVSINTRGIAALMTENHRVPYRMTYGNGERLQYKQAGSITAGVGLNVPVAGRQETDSVPLSDDEVMLAAWMLTDGCISAKVSISQSKPDTTKEIRELLARLGIAATERTRRRDIKSICGRELIKDSLPSTEFHVRSAHAGRVAALLGVEWSCRTRGVKKEVPAWVGDLSDARFAMFIDTVVRANGHLGRQVPTCTSACIYGQRSVLDSLQAACVTHGYRASLKARARGGVFSFWALNIVRHDKLRVNGTSAERLPYKGPVFCLTTPTGNFFTRLNGCVHVTGNSRVERWCVDQAMSNSLDSQFLLDAIGPQTVLRLNERGIHFYRRSEIYHDGLPRGWLRLGKMCYVHELGLSKNAARDAAIRSAVNVTFGHTHRADEATVVFPGVGIVKAFNHGCLSHCQPIWKHSDPTSWSQGYGIEIIAKSGNFQHIHVPIWRGESLAGAMIERFKS